MNSLLDAYAEADSTSSSETESTSSPYVMHQQVSACKRQKVELPVPDIDFMELVSDKGYSSVLGRVHSSPRSAHFPSRHRDDMEGGDERARAGSSTRAQWIRNMPHVEGNWATHVSIRVPNTDELIQLAKAGVTRGTGRLKRGMAASSTAHAASDTSRSRSNATDAGIKSAPPVIDAGLKAAPDFVCNDLGPDAVQHLSLSRTVYLRGHQVEPFVADVKKALTWATRFSVSLCEDFQLLVNDDRTRSFITVGVDGGTDKLRSIIECVDEVLVRYKQPVYYKDPVFHISVASSLGDLSVAWAAGGEGSAIMEGVHIGGSEGLVKVDGGEAKETRQAKGAQRKGSDEGVSGGLEIVKGGDVHSRVSAEHEDEHELSACVEVSVVEVKAGHRVFNIELR